MIRLPPTGITLSQQDLKFHLQQIDIYHGLLKQGFRKRDIIRHFDEQRAAADASAKLKSLRSEDLTAPSTLDLALRPRISSPTDDTLASGFQSVRTSSEEEADYILQLSENQETNTPSPECTKLTDEALTPEDAGRGSSTIENSRARQHAPRQSSLLRFAQTVSSSSDSGLNPSASFSPTSTITYRHRSETYPYVHSEVDQDLSGESESGKSLVDEVEYLSLSDELVPISQNPGMRTLPPSNLRPEADEFMPLYLPPPFSSTLRATSRPSHSSHSADLSQAILAASPRLPASDTFSDHRGRNDRMQHLRQSSSTSSSSPLHLSHRLTQEGSAARVSSPSLPPIPVTPRRATPFQPSHGQGVSHQYLDGSFTVYDDSIPASTQPQTPTDVARGMLVTEYTAAYTAPPGMVRSEFVRGGHYSQHLRQTSGEVSPTARAVMMRERRHREFARSARIESLRFHRTREVHGSLPRQPAEDRPGLGVLELWRDDLDADRVGEENAEAERPFPATNGMRIISGNRRRH